MRNLVWVSLLLAVGAVKHDGSNSMLKNGDATHPHSKKEKKSHGSDAHHESHHKSKESHHKSKESHHKSKDSTHKSEGSSHESASSKESHHHSKSSEEKPDVNAQPM
ncbi:MAG: hypothetical protein KVP17_001348 [Porospora cf. gigantea B]|uniref:uncharacterized protein n=1 Tax=Porospora cf. gigantea B TaxID=2853592 RepID=UPI0035717C77|nr:MAG: hypothetical protein KVP17_001348 [Porospora cf. gigantea B]